MGSKTVKVVPSPGLHDTLIRARCTAPIKVLMVAAS